jgi:ribosomal protein S18 acetylase RimI-like enzyme
MAAVEYVLSDVSALESVRPLWLLLNNYHHIRTRSFKEHYEQMTFDDRKAYFEGLARTGSLRVDLARDPATGRDVGYCVSSLSREKNGEIESIFVEEMYRGHAIGSTLVSRALTWMKEAGAVRIRVSVADGNEPAWEFYRKFGFLPRMIVLEIPSR